MIRQLAAVAVLLLVAGCTGEQSALAPRGIEAQEVFDLFVVMTLGAVLISILVAALTVEAIAGGSRTRDWLRRERAIIGLGAVLPAIVLTALLAWGLSILSSRAQPIPEDAVAIAVSGEQWWWRVGYTLPDGSTVESANELRVPVGRPVAITLTSPDVIHSFWVPSLAGKLDMIPGRENVLVLTATAPGTYRGQCAEYCGGAHALMAFHVVAMEPNDFEAWLAAEAGPAIVPQSDGAALFLQAGCAACHTVRGSGATGVIGPDLTHVGSRHSLGAATLPNTAEAFASWIVGNQHLKPDNHMPPFATFSDDELQVLSLWLESLK